MPIKVFRSDQVGAPTLNGQAGSLVGVLDACLVNGYGEFSVTAISRSGGIATLTASSAHNLSSGDVMLLVGADQPEYVGEFVVTVLTPTVLTFEVGGAPASPATGTVTARRAPANFTVPFTGQDVRVYRSSDPRSRRHYYRVTDDATTVAGDGRIATIAGFLAMTSLSAGLGQYPSAFWGKGLHALKSGSTAVDSRSWVVITDGKTVYAWLSYNQSSSNFSAYYYNCWLCFGDMAGADEDAYAAFVSASDSTNTTWSTGRNPGLPRPAGNTGTDMNPSNRWSSLAIARGPGHFKVSGYGSDNPQSYGTAILGHGLTQLTLGQSAFIAWPTPHNKVLATQLRAFSYGNGAEGHYRGKIPGVYESLHGATFGNAGVGQFHTFPAEGGGKLMYMNAGDSGTAGHLLIDITGPWD